LLNAAGQQLAETGYDFRQSQLVLRGIGSEMEGECDDVISSDRKFYNTEPSPESPVRSSSTFGWSWKLHGNMFELRRSFLKCLTTPQQCIRFSLL